jgi:hypothetical protein
MRATLRFRWAKFLAASLFVSVICNGAISYLKRTGVLDQDAYRAYWAVHCNPVDPNYTPAREPQCSVLTTPTEIALADSEALDGFGDPRYIYQVTPAERVAKLVKDLFVMLAAVISIWAITPRRRPLASLSAMQPVHLLAVYFVIMAGVSLVANGPVIAAAGLRSTSFILIALLAAWLVPHLPAFAAAVVALLVVQALLVPFELFRGIHLFHEWSRFALASRVAGTLAQPNSLGVFAVAGLAFYFSFSRKREYWWPLAVLTVALVAFSGSGTGLVCAALAAAAMAMGRLKRRGVVIAASLGFLALLGVLAVLPTLTGRDDVLASVSLDGGRANALRAALMERPAAQVIFGRGLGVDTNTVLNLLGVHGQNALDATAPLTSVPADSTVTALIIQVGIVGTLLFYSALLWAVRRDPVATPFYAVLALCSLTINVTELFPVNVLLGLAWARSAAQEPSGNG